MLKKVVKVHTQFVQIQITDTQTDTDTDTDAGTDIDTYTYTKYTNAMTSPSSQTYSIWYWASDSKHKFT